MTQESNKPIFEKRIAALRVSIWENRDQKGNAFHNVTIVRRFKVGDEWNNSNSYTGLADLALLREAVELAQQWLRDHEFQSATGE